MKGAADDADDGMSYESCLGAPAAGGDGDRGGGGGMLLVVIQGPVTSHVTNVTGLVHFISSGAETTVFHTTENY